MPTAEDLHERARVAVNTGAFTRATRLLDRASQVVDDVDLAARIELTRTYVEAETGRVPEAIDACLLLLDREDLTESTRGLVWAELGLLRMRAGDGDPAMQHFAEALDLLPADLHDDVGVVYLNRGNVHLQRRDARAAAKDFTAARDEFATAGREVQQAKAEHNLGYARLLTGDLVGAIQMIDEAAEVLAPQSPTYKATVEQDRAEILTAAGRPREAVAALETAAAAYGSRQLRTYQAECELTLAWTLLREDPARARVVARRAARRFRAQASAARALRADAAALVAEVATGGRSPAVLGRADALAADLRVQGLENDAVVVELQAARVCVRRGDTEAARTRLSGSGSAAPLPCRPGCSHGRCAPSWRRPGGSRAVRGRTSARASTTCTAGSRPSAAWTCRAPSWVTDATSPSTAWRWPSTAATPVWSSSGPSARGPWWRGWPPSGHPRTSRWPAT